MNVDDFLKWSNPPVNGLTTFFSEESFNKIVGTKTFYHRFLEKATAFYGGTEEKAGGGSGGEADQSQKKKLHPKNFSDKTRAPADHAGELEELYDGGDEISSHSKKLQFRLPLPPRKSCLTSFQHKRYTKLFKKYYNCVSQYLKTTEQKELLELQNLQSLIAPEQEEFQKLLEEISRKTPDHYHYIHAEAARYVEEKLAAKRKRVEQYPQYYSSFDSVPLTVGSKELENPPPLMYGGPLLEFGQIPDIVLPSLKAQVKPHVSRDYSKVNRRFPASHVKTENHLSDCCQDQNAECLAQKWNCKVVMSSSVLKCLIDNHGPLFTRGWEIPVTVKEYEICENNEKKMLKVVFLDKPLCPKTLTSRERNFLYHKYALRALLSILHKTEKVASAATPKQTEPIIKSEDPFGADDVNMEDLEIFGTTENKNKKLIQPKLMSPRERPGKKNKKFSGTDTSDLFDAGFDITNLESFGDRKLESNVPSSKKEIVSSDTSVYEDIQIDVKDCDVKTPSDSALNKESFSGPSTSKLPDSSDHQNIMDFTSDPGATEEHEMRKDKDLPTETDDSSSEDGSKLHISEENHLQTDVNMETNLGDAFLAEIHSPKEKNLHDIQEDVRVKNSSSKEVKQNDTPASVSSTVIDNRPSLCKNKRKRQNSKDNETKEIKGETQQEGHIINTRSKKKLVSESLDCVRDKMKLKQEPERVTPRRSSRNMKPETSSTDTPKNTEERISNSRATITRMTRQQSQNIASSSELDIDNDSDSENALWIDIPESPEKNTSDDGNKLSGSAVKDEVEAQIPVVTRRKSDRIKKQLKPEDDETEQYPISPEANKMEETSSETTAPGKRGRNRTDNNLGEKNKTTEPDTCSKSKEAGSVCLEIVDIASPDSISDTGSHDVSKESCKSVKSEPAKVVAWDFDDNDGAVTWDYSKSEVREKSAEMTDVDAQETSIELSPESNKKTIKKVVTNTKRKKDVTPTVTPLDSILQMQDNLITTKLTDNTDNKISCDDESPKDMVQEMNSVEEIPESGTGTGSGNANEFSEYKDVKYGNTSYHRWFTGGIPLLIRCHCHGNLKSDKKVYNANIFPKLEYHSLYGVEKSTPSEICREWVSNYITPNSICLRARIHAFTSELLLLEELDMVKILQNKAVYNPKYGFALLNKIMTKLLKLPLGRYLLNHPPKDPHCYIKNSVLENKRGVYDLHKSHCLSMNRDNSREPLQWIPLDPTVLLYHHQKSGRIPMTFEPKEFLTSVTFYGKKDKQIKKKKKKGKNKKAQ